jgi:hypothetical protein
VGVGRNIPARQANQGQGESRPPVSSGGGTQKHWATGPQEFVQASRVPDVDLLLSSLQHHQSSKPIQPPHEPAGYQGTRESNTGHLPSSQAPQGNPDRGRPKNTMYS